MTKEGTSLAGNATSLEPELPILKATFSSLTIPTGDRKWKNVDCANSTPRQWKQSRTTSSQPTKLYEGNLYLCNM